VRYRYLRTQVNHYIGHGRQLRRLRHEKLPLIAAQTQDFPLHRHEHAFALRIQWSIGLIRE
jgi:hypothetical protein